jgi:hypothetical protein
MIQKTKTIIVYLDVLAIIMTGGQVFFDVIKGLSQLSLIYNLVYLLVVLVSLILSLFFVLGINANRKK